MCSAVRHTVKRGVVDGHPLLPNLGSQTRGGGNETDEIRSFLPNSAELLLCVLLAGEARWSSLQAR